MGRKETVKILVRGISKDLRYHNISTLINKGVIVRFSDIIRFKYIPPSVLARSLNINPKRFYTNFTDDEETDPEQKKYIAYNFATSHILTLSLLFEVSPTNILELILKDDTSELKKL